MKRDMKAVLARNRSTLLGFKPAAFLCDPYSSKLDRHAYGISEFRVKKIGSRIAGAWGLPDSTVTRLSAPCRLAEIDPFLPFKIGSMNGREARESGLRLKASVAPAAGIR
jgi:hypothetical protein